MKLLMLGVALAACVLLRAAPAMACGGPSVDEVDAALAPATRVVSNLLSEDPYWEGGRDRKPFRFLDPFVLSNRASGALLAPSPMATRMARRTNRTAARRPSPSTRAPSMPPSSPETSRRRSARPQSSSRRC